MAGVVMARRLRNLGLLELFFAVSLPAVFLTRLGVTAGGVAAWGAVAAVLVVGGCYWLARATRARRGLACTPGLHAFAVARPVLVVVLAVTAVIVAVEIAAHGGLRWVAAGVWLFAVAEYVNYFHVQLTYHNGADLRRLRRRRRPVPARLGRELAAERTRGLTPDAMSG